VIQKPRERGDPGPLEAVAPKEEEEEEEYLGIMKHVPFLQIQIKILIAPCVIVFHIFHSIVFYIFYTIHI
jgi:hypothetical protein